METASKQHLCAGCNKPIAPDDVGGMSAGEDGNEKWFHNNANCMALAAHNSIQTHRHMMVKIAKELSHGRPGIEKSLCEPPFVADRNLGF